MNRRELLAGGASGIAVGIGGCLAPLARRTSGSDGGLRFVGVYAADADRDFIDGAYIALENAAADPLPVSGYVVAFPSDRRHRLEDLTLEPGAQLALVLDRGEDSTLLSSPPCYLRYTGSDADAAASELPANGDVRVKDATGSIVAEARYEKFGCDGGTVTTSSGDDVECLHRT